MFKLARLTFKGVTDVEEINLPTRITEMTDVELSDKMYLLSQWTCFAIENKVQAEDQLRRVKKDLEEEESKAFSRPDKGTVEARKRGIDSDPDVVHLKELWCEAKQVSDLVESYISRYDRLSSLLSRELTRRLNSRSQY